MGGEGVIDEMDAFGASVIGDFFCRGNATDAPSIDLHKPKTCTVDHVFGLMKIVAAFATSKFDSTAPLGERTIRLQRSGDKRLLQPKRSTGLQRRKPLRGLGDIIAPNCSGIHEQDRVPAEALARGVNLFLVLFYRAAAIGSPAEFGSAVSGAGNLLRLAKRALRIISKQLRGVCNLRISAFVTEQLIDRLSELFAQKIPQRHIDS